MVEYIRGQSSPLPDDEEPDDAEDAFELQLDKEPDAENNPPPFDKIPLGSIDKPRGRDSEWIGRECGYFKGFRQKPEFKHFHKELVEYFKFLRTEYCPDHKTPHGLDESAPLGVRFQIS